MRKLLYTFIQTVLLAIVSCIGLSLQAQDTPFIQSIDEGQLPTSPEMNAYLGRLRKNPNITGYHFVTLNPLASSQKDGVLPLHIPDGPSITAVASHVEYESAIEYEWTGKTDDGRGTAIVIAKAGRVCAHISTPTGVYEIFPAPGGLHCLREIDPEKASDVGCETINRHKQPENGRIAVEVQTTEITKDSNAKTLPCQPITNPRVLVLYTQNALNIAGNFNAIVDQANLSIAQFNSCIYSSGITSAATLQLAGVTFLNFQEGNGMGSDITILPNNASAQSLRNQYQADLVVLYTDGALYGARGATADPFFNNATAYSIVQILNSVTNKTFAHEVGHIFGCRHDGISGNPQYAQGYNIKNGLGFVIDRTMMSTNTPDGSNRLLNFSNPNILVGGKATGTAANNNNAQRIIDTYTTVGNFRANPNPTFGAYIEGSSLVLSESSRTYELVYSCGSVPYTFKWEYSNDGINYYNANTNADLLTWYFYQTQMLFLKGTVTANGQSYTAFISVDAQIPNGYRSGQPENANSDTQFTASPNPTSDNVLLRFNLPSSAKVKLNVFDVSGKITQPLINDEIERPAGNYSYDWHIKNASPGTYLVNLNINGHQEVRRIVVTK